MFCCSNSLLACMTLALFGINSDLTIFASTLFTLINSSRPTNKIPSGNVLLCYLTCHVCYHFRVLLSSISPGIPLSSFFSPTGWFWGQVSLWDFPEPLLLFDSPFPLSSFLGLCSYFGGVHSLVASHGTWEVNFLNSCMIDYNCFLPDIC